MAALRGLVLSALLLGGCSSGGNGQAASAPAGAPVAAASGSGAPEPARRNRSTIAHTLRIGDTQDITSLNPHLATATSLGNLSELTMAYLVRYDARNRPVPELATVVPTQQNHLISADGLTITWHLRRGVRWSDGAPFDGDDVVFSTNAVNNPQNNETGRDGWDLITKIDEPDKYTVVYHLKRPYSPFLPMFFGTAGANPCLIPKHILGSLANINNAPYNSKPVGIGPFRYVQWVRGDRVELESNPYYWGGKPKLQKIVYRFIADRNTLLTQIETGEVDLWPYVGLGYYERVKALRNVTTRHNPGFYFTHLDFNNTRPLFAERAVREALRYAVDRRTLRDKIQHGLGIIQAGPITPVSPLYTALPQSTFDPAKARAILAAAGWKPGADGVRAKNGHRLSFDFATLSGTPDVDQQIEIMRSNWQQIGAQINVLHYPPPLMFAPYQDGGIVYGGKFDMIAFSWGTTPDGNLGVFLDCNQIPPAGQNDARYCDRKLDPLFKRFNAAYGEADRKTLDAAIQRQLVADIPEIVLWVREDIFTYNNDLTNWHPNAVTPFDDMLRVDI